MEVTNASVEPVMEHGGSCKTFFLVPKESMRKETEGSYLEFVSEFEIAAGTRLEPHKHDTHEYYYILSGKALMQVGGEKREVKPGDLIHIPRNVVHSIAPAEKDVPLRALAFAASFLPAGGAGSEAERAELPV
jgi:quercetin dioxygenase-like cupin family protein